MVDKEHGRIEWRGIEVKETTPEQMGFPHAAQVARIDRIRELKGGKQEVETVWIVTSLTAQQASPARLLELVRTYWSIENGTHYRLDVSAGEDLCRVRHPVAATVFGILRRAVQGEFRAWARGQPCGRDRTYPTFAAMMSRRINLLVRFTTGSAFRLRTPDPEPCFFMSWNLPDTTMTTHALEINGLRMELADIGVRSRFRSFP